MRFVRATLPACLSTQRSDPSFCHPGLGQCGMSFEGEGEGSDLQCLLPLFWLAHDSGSDLALTWL